jgi:hypothetical protein
VRLGLTPDLYALATVLVGVVALALLVALRLGLRSLKL